MLLACYKQGELSCSRSRSSLIIRRKKTKESLQRFRQAPLQAISLCSIQRMIHHRIVVLLVILAHLAPLLMVAVVEVAAIRHNLKLK